MLSLKAYSFDKEETKNRRKREILLQQQNGESKKDLLIPEKNKDCYFTKESWPKAKMGWRRCE